MDAPDSFEQRVGFNEATFRTINEGIARGEGEPGDAKRVGFRCECARLGCTTILEIPPAEYEAVRAHGRRFVVAPGHVVPETETVVARHGSYEVIEKHGEAGRVADATNPRGGDDR
jgi:hypothetical protein